MIDSHCHLYVEQFSKDVDLAIARAKEIGVQKFVMPAIDSAYQTQMQALQRKYPKEIFLMAGLHPCSVKENSYQKELDFVYQNLQSQQYVAVGEIGIDLYWDKSTLAIQKNAFAQQIAWAKEFDLPIVIHCRESFDEIFEVLEANCFLTLRGIFHCFTGTLDQAKRAIALGMKLGIGGVVTFKNGKIDQFLHKIDLQYIVLETDSPYLAPKPNRGKRNEPAYLALIANKLAEIYKVTPLEIQKRTTRNTAAIFNLV